MSYDFSPGATPKNFTPRAVGICSRCGGTVMAMFFALRRVESEPATCSGCGATSSTALPLIPMDAPTTATSIDETRNTQQEIYGR